MRCTVTDVERYRKLNKEDYLTGGVLKKGQPPFFCPRKGRRKMSKKAGTALSVMAMIFMGALASPLTVLAADAEETYQPALYATIWALLPPSFLPPDLTVTSVLYFSSDVFFLRKRSFFPDMCKFSSCHLFSKMC